MFYNPPSDSEEFQRALKHLESSYSLSEWKERYEKFIKMDHSNLTYEKLDQIFSDLHLLLPLDFMKLGEEDKPIWRVRTNWNESEDLTNPQNFSYPPPECSNLMRCSKEGQSMFYGSEFKKAALLETFDAYENSGYAFMGKWRFKVPSTTINPIFVYPHYNFSPSSPYYSYHLELNKRSREANEKVGGSAAEYLNIANEKITEAFLEDNHFLTSWLAHKYLFDYNKRGLSGIVYPSVKADQLIPNIALAPDLVDARMNLEKVFYFKYSISSHPSKKDTYIAKSSAPYVGQNINGKLHWRESSTEDLRDFQVDELFNEEFVKY